MIKPQTSGFRPIVNTIKYLNYRMTNKEKSRKFLRQWLASFPGVSAKISQIIDDHLVDELESPNDKHSYAVPFDDVAVLINEYSPKLAADVIDINKDSKVASVGQVHQITMRDGRKYALKIQYPGIDTIIKEQVDKLFKLYNILPFKHRKNFVASSYQEHIGNILFNETNYIQEAKVQQQFFTFFNKHYTKTIVPQVYLDRCSSKLLLQQWIEGVCVAEFSKRKKPEKLDAAAKLTTIFFEMLFNLRVIQTDFNFGNIAFKVSENGPFESVILYDFGATQIIEDNHAAILFKIIEDTVDDSAFSLFDHFVSLGFDGSKLKYIAHLLPAVANLLLEPFIYDRPYKISDWNLKNRLNSILGEDKWWFRASGPPWFFIFLKAVNGLFAILEKFDVAVNYHKLFVDFQKRGCYVGGLQAKILKDQHKKFDINNYASNDLATHLNIKLFVDNKEKVDLQMPCRVVDILEEIMPHEYADLLANRSIDLENLKKNVQRSGYAKQTIIEEQYDNRKIKIWIS